jgi:hypothetical protein
MMHDHNCIYISKGLNTKRAAGVIERWNNPINQYSTLECARRKYSFTASPVCLFPSTSLRENKSQCGQVKIQRAVTAAALLMEMYIYTNSVVVVPK